MYKKTIVYKDLSGGQRAEDFYFQLNEAEFAIMELRVKGGYVQMLQDMIANAEDHPGLVIDTFQDLIRQAFGVRHENGVTFDKDPKHFRLFKDSDAYNKFFMMLLTDTNEAVAFTNGIMPDSVRENAESSQVSDKPSAERTAELKARLQAPVEEVHTNVFESQPKSLADDVLAGMSEEQKQELRDRLS